MGDIFTWISTAVLGVCGQPVDIVYTEESCGSYAVPSLSSVNEMISSSTGFGNATFE